MAPAAAACGESARQLLASWLAGACSYLQLAQEEGWSLRVWDQRVRDLRV